MTIKSTVLGDIDIYWTDADPTVTPIDAAKGSWVFYQNGGGMPSWFIKTDDGPTTSVGTVIARSDVNALGVPTVNDDITQGFRPHSMWTYSGTTYICQDSTVGAAVWKAIT